MPAPAYSQFFSTLYDEPGPVGYLGRGTHYSILRCAEWFDVTRRPLQRAEIHDFAVIWDEDHDERIIRVIEQIYLEGLLSPIQFIGERKGSVTIILAARYYFSADDLLQDYERRLGFITEQALDDDSWHAELGTFDRRPGSPHQVDLKGLIHAPEEHVITYVRNIDNLWKLGTRPHDQR